jgi:hypothetical protein
MCIVTAAHYMMRWVLAALNFQVTGLETSTFIISYFLSGIVSSITKHKMMIVIFYYVVYWRILFSRYNTILYAGYITIFITYNYTDPG